MVNDILRDMDIEMLAREAHLDCLECDEPGCRGCPAGSACDLPRLVRHEREVMHEGCIAAFDAHVANRCTGDVCNCASDGVPVLLADDDGDIDGIETARIPYEPMKALVFAA